MEKKSFKLALSKETLRRLAQPDLKGVAGANTLRAPCMTFVSVCVACVPTNHNEYSCLCTA
jgi:hypothetical protein